MMSLVLYLRLQNPIGSEEPDANFETPIIVYYMDPVATPPQLLSDADTVAAETQNLAVNSLRLDLNLYSHRILQRT
jgi:hypothetical protein